MRVLLFLYSRLDDHKTECSKLLKRELQRPAFVASVEALMLEYYMLVRTALASRSTVVTKVTSSSLNILAPVIKGC